ncbi:Uncharacterized protein OBRU01_22740, partial [Operophtera brumata]
MLAKDGLAAQLLARVVARERPDLQQAKTDLTTQGAEHRRLLQEIERKILNVLSTSEHLLEDEEAVQILNSAKDTSNEIKEKQVVAMVTEQAIDTARDDYVPIAVHATNLLNEMDGFRGILDHFISNIPAWEEYCNSPDAHNQPLPLPWEKKLSSFE